MKKVIVIDEDNHGIVGVAKTLDGVFDCLCDGDWLHDGTPVWDEEENNYNDLVQVFGPTWNEIIKEKLKTISDFNTFFEGVFYLEEFEIY